MVRTAAILLLGLVAGAVACAVPVEFDLVIRGGTVYEGSGATPTGVRQIDVGIRGDRIAALGDLTGRRISRIIDASGLVVAPGFIGGDGGSGLSLLLDGSAESHVRQGVTTVVTGVDGNPAFWSDASADRDTLTRYGLLFDWDTPAAFGARLEARGAAVNVATLMPASAARQAIVGQRTTPASAAEQAAMDALVDGALAAGAFGVSGRPGVPSDGKTPDELAALGRAVAARGGVLVLRQRDGALPPDETVGELVAIATAAGGRTIVAGLRLPGEEHWGDGLSLGNTLGDAQRAGVRISATVAPFPDARDGAVSESDVRGLLGSGAASVGSGRAPEAWTTGPVAALDPVAYDTFTRVLGTYAGDDGVFTLIEAIRRLTALAADQFGIPDRGLVREGYFADLVVFDPSLVAEPGAAATPYPRGIAYVVVNGVLTVTPDGHTGSRAGRWLRGPAADGP
jgi:N-acyl-D-amino-acid deacylase